MSVNRKYSIVAATVCSILILAVSSLGANSNAGTAAYTFLKIGTGAKSQALGGAFVGLADDESALYYNAAGLTAKSESYETYDDLLDKPIEDPVYNRFTATYINYLLDFQYGFVGYTRELDEQSAAGISIAYQNYGTFDRIDPSGEEIGTFGASDIAIGLTYSKRLKPRFSAGATGKFIYETIDEYSSNGLAMDLGIMYLIDPDGSTRLGVAISNLGAQLSGFTETHKDPLPTKMAMGLSHKLRGLPFLFSTEVGKPFDSDFYFAVGSQLISLEPFFIRVGWSSTGKDYRAGDDSDTMAGFAGGFGYTYEKYTIDYSYSSYVDLGSVHRISLGAGF
jgi:hypothetical protein